MIDFDKLASVQRIIAVPTEKIVEKEVDRAVLVPTKDSEIIRNELAMSVLIEKLILEILIEFFQSYRVFIESS